MAKATKKSMSRSPRATNKNALKDDLSSTVQRIKDQLAELMGE